MAETLVAVDVGTSGARATAFTVAGERVLEARRGYPTISSQPGWAEQDPRAWRSAAIGALADLVRRLGPASGWWPSASPASARRSAWWMRTAGRSAPA